MVQPTDRFLADFVLVLVRHFAPQLAHLEVGLPSTPLTKEEPILTHLNPQRLETLVVSGIHVAELAGLFSSSGDHDKGKKSFCRLRHLEVEFSGRVSGDENIFIVLLQAIAQSTSSLRFCSITFDRQGSSPMGLPSEYAPHFKLMANANKGSLQRFILPLWLFTSALGEPRFPAVADLNRMFLESFGLPLNCVAGGMPPRSAWASFHHRRAFGSLDSEASLAVRSACHTGWSVLAKLREDLCIKREVSHSQPFYFVSVLREYLEEWEADGASPETLREICVALDSELPEFRSGAPRDAESAASVLTNAEVVKALSLVKRHLLRVGASLRVRADRVSNLLQTLVDDVEFVAACPPLRRIRLAMSNPKKIPIALLGVIRALLTFGAGQIFGKRRFFGEEIGSALLDNVTTPFKSPAVAAQARSCFALYLRACARQQEYGAECLRFVFGIWKSLSHDTKSPEQLSRLFSQSGLFSTAIADFFEHAPGLVQTLATAFVAHDALEFVPAILSEISTPSARARFLDELWRSAFLESTYDKLETRSKRFVGLVPEARTERLAAFLAGSDSDFFLGSLDINLAREIVQRSLSAQ